MKSELQELLTYFSSTNYGAGYFDEVKDKFVYAHKDASITETIIEGHLQGRPIGVNTSLDDWGRTKAVVFDIDCKHDGEADRRDDIYAKLTAALTKDNVPFLTFKSGSGNGFHIFVLFSRAVEKSYARLFGEHYAELIGVEPVSGILEIFPKSNRLRDNKGQPIVENIALPLARKSKVIGEFKIVPFDPVTWKPTWTPYQLDGRSKIAAAFVEDADGKVAAYGVKIPAQVWNSALGKETIAKAGFAYFSTDGQHIYALCFPANPQRANSSRSKAKEKFGEDFTEVLKTAPPLPYEGLAFQVVMQGDDMAYVTRRAVSVQPPAKPGRKGKAQDNDAAFDCAAKMYRVDAYSLPKEGGWLEFMMACHSAFRAETNKLAWVRGRFLEWSATSAKHDSKNDPAKFDEEGPRSDTPPQVFWAKAIQGGYKGATPYPKKDLDSASMIDLVLDGKHVFLGPQRKPYIEMADRHYVLLESREFSLYARDKVYTGLGKPLSKDAIDSISATIESTIRGDEIVPVATRCASHNDKAYLFLADKDCTVIEIDDSGWHECISPPVRFAKTAVMDELPKPEAGGSIDQLSKFINFGDDENSRLFTLAWLVKTILKPDSVTPALVFQGEKGSGKTSALEHTAMLVDPQSVLTAAPPKTETDLVISAVNSYIVSFDNVSGFDAQFSDAICRLITGGGIKGRMLYTNGEMHVLKAKRPLIFSGIDPGARRPDLVERFLFIDLQRVQNFVSDDELRAAFLKAWPSLLGALLTLCVQTKKTMATFPAPATNRMADYCHVGEALSRVFGNPDDHFVTMYNDQAKAEQEGTSDGDIVVRMMHLELASIERRNAPREKLDLVLMLDRWAAVQRDLGMVGKLPHDEKALRQALGRHMSALTNGKYRVVKDWEGRKRIWVAESIMPGRVEFTMDVPLQHCEITLSDGRVVSGDYDPIMNARVKMAEAKSNY